jgi:D-alanyl-D-alanine carboxypeptidase/D-alanyl-D-alanine-endopeptidase (penicillin-binding protein 4)
VSGLKELGFTVLSRKNGGRIKFYGSYPAACGRYALTRAVSDSTDHVLGVFASIWSSLGGSVSGRSVRGDTPDDARVLHTYLSPTVAEIIGTINKFSNNVMSRQLLLTMGAEKFNPPGTLKKGREAISRWLAQAGLKFPELFVDNGAGLSRRTRISARSLGALLIAAHKSPLMPEFVSSLPLLAVDGTLRKRFKNSPMAGRVHLKTGTIDDVRAMGGYLLTKDGRTLVVVSLHNHKGIQFHSGTEIQNALLEWLYSR